MEREPLEIKPVEEIILPESCGMQRGIIAHGIVSRQGEKLSAIPAGALFVVHYPQREHLMAAYQTFEGIRHWQYFECQSAEVIPLNFSAS